MAPDERSLGEYLEDIRQIRETMLMAEDRLHVPPWFFFAMAALLAVGTGVHVVVDAVRDLPLTTALVVIWLPVFILAGVAEVGAWVARGRREGLPWMSAATGRFLATIGGMMVALATLALAALFAGYSPAGIAFLAGACIFLGYAPYSPGVSIWIGWTLLAPGLGLLIAEVSSEALLVIAAAVVVVAFLVDGVVEQRYQRTHG